MSFQDAHTAKIACIRCARRRNDAGKGNWQALVVREPPVSVVEFRYGSIVEECQPMQVGEHVGNFVVLSVNLAESCT